MRIRFNTFAGRRSGRKQRQTNWHGNGFVLPDSQQPITREELERAGQQKLRFRPFTPEEERCAVDWWAGRIVRAEATTGNDEASRDPKNYVKKFKTRLLSNEDALTGIVEEWRKAGATGTLDEPIWSEKVSERTPATRSRGTVA
jgi:hypothetical protein